MTYGKQIGKTIYAYMDSIDFECEAESIETRLYPSLLNLPQDGCFRKSCGLYRLKIEAVEYISPEEIRRVEKEGEDA